MSQDLQQIQKRMRNQKQYSHSRDRRNHQSRNHSRSRSRSREKRRFKNNSYSYDHQNNRKPFNNQKSYNNNNYDRRGNKGNYYNNNNRKWDKTQRQRKIHRVQIQDPKQFTIGQNTTFNHEQNSQNTLRFKINIKKSPNYPLPKVVEIESEENKKETLSDLKNKITPIERIWTSHIKQYLNDSEFVQIFRKNKSLAYGQIQYGKTMIKYRQPQQILDSYNNSTSQSKIFSRAYFKLWEILAMGVFQGKQNQQLKIASVAEGPGGFIHGLIDYRLKNAKVKDQFSSITLRIDENTRNAKDWSDPRGKTFFDEMRMDGYLINLSYGESGTGDLLKVSNIDYFAEKDLDNEKCYLVTGDGGIQCIGDKQFDYQEIFNVKLFLGQILTALKVQAIGGKFILKVYDCAFEITKELLTLLTVFYDKVRMVKPITSRPGNSEKYMYCEGFRGMSKEEEIELKKLLVSWTQIQPQLAYFENKEFVQNIIEFPNLKEKDQIFENLDKVNEYFMIQQAQKLKSGLNLAKEHDNDCREIEELLRKKRFEEQMSYAYTWCKKYGLVPIDAQIRDQ